MKKRGQSDRSRQQARAVLSKGLRAAVEDDLLMVNPARDARKIVVKRRPIAPLNAAEVAQLLASIDDVSLELRLRVSVLFGLRQGEALGLRWEDVDLEAMTLKVRVQVQQTESGRGFASLKTSSSRRDLYFGPKLKSIFEEHRALQNAQRERAGVKWEDHGLIFCNRRGRPVQARWDNELWHRALRRAGIDDRRLHDARHTAATLLYSDGHDIEAIRQFLGHSDIGTTSRTYVHPDAAPMRRIAESTEIF
jgi:integrase